VLDGSGVQGAQCHSQTLCPSSLQCGTRPRIDLVDVVTPGTLVRQSKISRVEIDSRLNAESVKIGFEPLVGPGAPHVAKVLQEIPIGVQST
jgi:hypothetical protein